ncbi:MAG: hypothetical protein DBX47_07380 [Clostridiales bacterium]|nr:MAG: hypothetical protein DBX47_07380 [Clostridiales bacterium]
MNEGFASTYLGISESSAAFWLGLNEGFATTYLGINESSAALLTGLGEGFSQFWTSIGEGTNTLWQTTKTTANELWAELTNGFTNLWILIDERFKNLWGSITIGNTGLWNATDANSSSLLSKISSNFTNMWNNVSKGNTDLWTETKDCAAVMLNGLRNDFNNFWSAIPEGMKGMAREICNILNKLLSWLVSPINAIIKGFNKIPFVNLPELNPTISPPTFAQGGFPTQGQMFIAREAGPELVGNIGSRSAVVNNDQIVESVSRGVYDAVRAAMSSANSGNAGPAEFNLYLDSKQITSSVERVQKERGLLLITG